MSCVTIHIPPGLTRIVQTYIDAMSEDVYQALCKSLNSDWNVDAAADQLISKYVDTATNCGIQNACPTREEIYMCAAKESNLFDGWFGLRNETAKKLMAEGALYFFEIYCKNGTPDKKNLVDLLNAIKEYVCNYKSKESTCNVEEPTKSDGNFLVDYWYVFAILSLVGILVAFVLFRS